MSELSGGPTTRGHRHAELARSVFELGKSPRAENSAIASTWIARRLKSFVASLSPVVERVVHGFPEVAVHVPDLAGEAIPVCRR